MQIDVDHDSLASMLARAGALYAAQHPLAGTLSLAAPLDSGRTGSPVVTDALLRLRDAWGQALGCFADDAAYLVEALRAVDARYVETEMTNAARFGDVLSSWCVAPAEPPVDPGATTR